MHPEKSQEALGGYSYVGTLRNSYRRLLVTDSIGGCWTSALQDIRYAGRPRHLLLPKEMLEILDEVPAADGPERLRDGTAEPLVRRQRYRL